MSDSDELLAQYLAAANDVRAAFSGLTREQLLAHPAPGKWSAMEVLCHLVDTDLSTAIRIRATLSVSSPQLAGVSREQMTMVLAANGRDAAEEMQVFTLIRSQTARIIRAMPGDAFSRDATVVKANGEVVSRTVAQFLSGITSHVAHHLAFVHEKRRLLGVS